MINTIADTNYLTLLFNGSSLPYQASGIAVTDGNGCSIEIQNYSPFILQIFQGKTLIEVLSPYSWLITDYVDKSTATILPTAQLPLAANAYITTNTIPQKQHRARGDFHLPLTQTVNTPVVNAPSSNLNTNITNTTLDITGSTVTANLPAGTAVDANISGSNVTLDTNSTVMNEILGINPSLASKTNTTTLDLAAGGSEYLSVDFPEAGLFDGFALLVHSPLGDIENYTFSLGGTNLNGVNTSYGFFPGGNFSFNAPTIQSGSTDALSYFLVPYTNPNYLSNITIGVKATNASTETLTVQIFARYASAEIVNSTSSPVPTQSQYVNTLYSLGSGSFTATVAADSTGPQAFTGSVPAASISSMQILIEQTAASGFVVNANPSLGAGLAIQLQGSFDNTTWSMIYTASGTIGDANNRSSFVLTQNGAFNEVCDSSFLEPLLSKYAYIRLVMFLYNGTSGSLSMTETCNIYINVVEG